MPIAAVPAYLGQDFKDASPGVRFGPLLPIWTDRSDQEAQVRQRAQAQSHEGRQLAELLAQRGMDAAIRNLKERGKLPGLWDKNDFASRRAWSEVKALSRVDRERMNALAARQFTVTAAISETALLRLDASAVAPFTTGLGNEHPLENGFAFLNPYGLPYLAGSGVKGVLRQAARELASGGWGDPRGWSTDRRYALQLDRETTIGLSAIDALFGFESADGSTDHVRGALTFWDVIPQIAGDSLQVEIMTPHQSHYYQQKSERKSGDSATPHDSGQPNPISFLTVPPGSGFTFIVTCDQRHLERLAPELAARGDDGQPRWKTLMRTAFEHAFEWLGFGAKTAVGYGAMQRDPKAEQAALDARKKAEDARKNEAEERERAAARQAMTEGQRMIDDFESAMKVLPQRKQPISGSNYQAIKKFADAMIASNHPVEEKRLAADAIERWAEALLKDVNKKDVRKKFGLTSLRGNG
jgi:CRISPR-associated protein Cmr6